MAKEVSNKVVRANTPINRKGEGVLVDMEVAPVVGLGGTAMAQLKLKGDASALPVPDRHYTADVCFVQYRQETIYLLFGQERFGRDQGLRNLLIIRMAPAAAIAYLKSWESSTWQACLAEAENKLKIKAESLSGFDSEPKETVTLSANLVLSALSGRESCMDFYYASPFSKAAVSQTRKLALDPVVRIDTRTGLMLGLHTMLLKVVSELPSEMFLEVAQGEG